MDFVWAKYRKSINVYSHSSMLGYYKKYAIGTTQGPSLGRISKISRFVYLEIFTDHLMKSW